ncbi:type I-B CRISPR-associated protein Cas7/Cst2/DevR [Methanobacterium petrolearium]|uniref:type I-B CRISPR-associated protein Cas7/Cst2/DevR n=1 Tax=Methanobacterium petrolearium TaxID=710190 RepID=UPI001AEA7EC2|nr:type I-B CRISPR-associated protein Cas7/Cst2/DevR [Methanobacterium petrolearium]MBP1946366.1 CRISPR-associated protein Cst2 [Methanobacterium petrolearium]BDZ70614.1 type I-B CRISPR-associated protein Cas7/Cst2/DevR [Methanobacterium petrolearium]
MSKTVVGFMLVDAPHSALNNAGADAGDRTDNIVRVKSIRRGRKVYPYVSGQALRYWWRDTLEQKYNWNVSPIERQKKIAFTSANPIEYDDDDVFGYMRALKAKEGGTVTRISPLKTSPLISVIGQIPTQDFGVMARHEGDPVPYEHEFYSTVLKGIFSLDLDSLGVFYADEKTGYRNMYPKLEEKAEEEGLVKDEKNNKWIMPEDIRIKRAQDTIKALPYLQGGAKLTSHLTDVSPKFLVLAVIDGGNHIFMNIVKEENGEPQINIEALQEVINEYSDSFLTNIYIGRRKGFMDELDEDIVKLTAENEKVESGTIKETVDQFAEKIPELIKQ